MAQDGTAGNVSVSDSQGIVAGTGNTQVNNWSPRTPLTSATLAALNPNAGAARIRQLSHDEAVDLFAEASPEVLVPKLRALLSADANRAVAVLADLDAGKAMELISPLAADFPWLVALSKADEAIVERAVNLKWDHESGAGRLELAPRSPQGTDGFFRQYRQGRIYWSGEKGDTSDTRGPIAEYHLASGATGGELGFPKKAEITWHSGRVDGSGQEFEGGYLFSSSHGTYSLSLELWNAWPRWLGFPLAGIGAHDGFTSQRFEEGVLYSSEAGTFAVRPGVAECASEGWVPLSAEEEVPSYPTGRVQRFKTADGVQVAVYSSVGGMTWPVLGNALALYDELGGPDSWLGFPLGKDGDSRRGWVYWFERGQVYDRPGNAPVAVPVQTWDLVGGMLGWPLSQEKAIGGSDDETIQYFERGAVIVRDGKREVWLRSDQPQSTLSQ